MATPAGKFRPLGKSVFLLRVQGLCSPASMVTRGYGDPVIQHDPLSTCIYVIAGMGPLRNSRQHATYIMDSPQVNPIQW